MQVMKTGEQQTVFCLKGRKKNGTSTKRTADKHNLVKYLK